MVQWRHRLCPNILWARAPCTTLHWGKGEGWALARAHLLPHLLTASSALAASAAALPAKELGHKANHKLKLLLFLVGSPLVSLTIGLLWAHHEHAEHSCFSSISTLFPFLVQTSRNIYNRWVRKIDRKEEKRCIFLSHHLDDVLGKCADKHAIPLKAAPIKPKLNLNDRFLIFIIFSSKLSRKPQFLSLLYQRVISRTLFPQTKGHRHTADHVYVIWKQKTEALPLTSTFLSLVGGNGVQGDGCTTISRGILPILCPWVYYD